MPAFVERIYYFDNCHVGYNLGGHVCKQQCKCCHAQTACAFQKWVLCPSCRRYFVSDTCYQTHLTSGVCNVVRSCTDCGKVYHTYNKHVCGMVLCKMCGIHQPQDHLCFIKPLNSADKGDEEEGGGRRKKKKAQRYIFYDFECILVDQQHVSNLCVIHKVCADCIENPMVEDCSCKREQIILRGGDTLQQVVSGCFPAETEEPFASRTKVRATMRISFSTTSTEVASCQSSLRTARKSSPWK